MKKISLLILTVLLNSAYAADANQTVPGQATDSPYEGPKVKPTPIEPSIYERKNPDADESDTPVYGKVKTSSPYENKKWKKSTSDFSQLPYGSQENYSEFKNSDLVKDNYQISKKTFGFSYYKDDYDYDDGTNVFAQTFDNPDSSKSAKVGYFMGSYRYNFVRGVFDLYMQTDTGLSYNTGRGVFPSDGKISKTRFNLWVVPLDIMIGTKVNLGRYMGISLLGGPSMAVIFQNRSDRDDKDDSKNLNQVGFGYTAQGSLDFSLSQMFPDYGMSLRNGSDVSDLSFSIIARAVSLGNFKEDNITIEGLSIGAGFRFEVL